MFYKFLKNGARVPVDLDDIYKGGSCFLAGGAPVLKKENVSLLNQPGIFVLTCQ